MKRILETRSWAVALLTVLGWMPILAAQTSPVGAQTSTGDPQVTFAKHVAPILQKSCQSCHRPGQMAPMSLLSYDEARPWARAIKSKVSTREMPPFYVDRRIGVQEFKNDPSLSDGEIATIVKWVDSGAPLGDPADLPAPRTFGDRSAWTVPGGEPDVVVYAPSYTTKANSREEWVELYAEFTLPEDRWVQAYEVKPSAEGLAVVHHDNVAMVDIDESGTAIGPSGFAAQYAPGKGATIYPSDAGVFLKAGRKRVQFGTHYSSIDRAVTDRSALGLKFYAKGQEPKKAIIRNIGLRTAYEDLDLPAGQSNIRSDIYTVTKDNLRVLSYLPHMHVHGKRQCVELIYPTGEAETMSCVNFNFAWQIVYVYADDVQPLVPKGTIVHVMNWHDNSVANKANPDPKNWKGYGQRTVDDMATTITEAIKLTDQELQQAIAARQQRTDRVGRR